MVLPNANVLSLGIIIVGAELLLRGAKGIIQSFGIAIRSSVWSSWQQRSDITKHLT